MARKAREIMKEITSLQNPLIKHLVKLRDDRKYRYEKKKVVIEGKKIVEELLLQYAQGFLFVTDPLLVPKEARGKDCYLVTKDILKKISGVQAPEGVIAELPFPPEADFEKVNYLLALDGVSDPGNLGTLLRSALALGWDGVFILNNCCDPFNDKALRAAKGATFKIPIKSGSWEELESIASKNGLIPLAADIKGDDAGKLDHLQKVLLVLGGEAKGLSEKTREICRTITVPISSRMESLNVSTAGGIIMYLLKYK